MLSNQTFPQWPADWNALLNFLQTQTAAPDFWKNLVTTHLTTRQFDNASEDTYKAFFKTFWVDNRSKIEQENGLFLAVRLGYDVLIDTRLRQIADPVERKKLADQKLSTNQETLLQISADKGHLQTVAVLLAAGANPSLQGRESETPLHRAAFRNHHEIAKLLLQHDASCNIKRFDGELPIHVAVMANARETIEAIVKHDKNKNQLQALGSEGRSPLYRATMECNSDVIKLLLSLGGEVSETNQISGLTFFHVASSKNDAASIGVLSQYSKDPDLLDNYGYTALQRCAMKFEPALEAAQALIHAGADVNKGTPPPLVLLAEHANKDSNKTVELAKLLVNKGADINAVTDGQTILERLDENRQTALYTYLKQQQSLRP